jgi:hypothetical protein
MVINSSILTLSLLIALPVQAAVNQSCANETGPSLRIHGRLGVYNGGYPNLRIWQIGTHHMYGVFGDSADLRCIRWGKCDGDDDTKLPSNLDALMRLPNPLFEFFVYGDFELRLLEPHKPGHQQAACIVSGGNLVRQRNSN